MDPIIQSVFKGLFAYGRQRSHMPLKAVASEEHDAQLPAVAHEAAFEDSAT